MRVENLKSLLTLSFLAISPASVLAADEPQAASDSTDPAELCTPMAAEDKNATLTQVRDAAIEVRRVLCVEGGKREEILAAFASMVAKLVDDRWSEQLGGFHKEGETEKVDPLLQVKEALQKQGGAIPTIGPTNETAISIEDEIYIPADPAKCGTNSQGKSCRSVLDEFRSHYNYAHTTFASEGAIAFAQTVSGLSKEWSEYLDTSRSFTPLELALNSYLYKRSETVQFSSPPKIQWIVLHPSIVIENVEDAADGENTKEALMVELAGANWWRQSKWYVPTGGSVITAYTDRPGVDDMGYGVALHFRSVYSIGYTRHGGENGVFITYDLLKLLQNEKKVLEAFKP